MEGDDDSLDERQQSKKKGPLRDLDAAKAAYDTRDLQLSRAAHDVKTPTGVGAGAATAVAGAAVVASVEKHGGYVATLRFLHLWARCPLVAAACPRASCLRTHAHTSFFVLLLRCYPRR
jgi:hypothetical protein